MCCHRRLWRQKTLAHSERDSAHSWTKGSQIGSKRTVGDVSLHALTLVAGEGREEQIAESGWFADFLQIASLPAAVQVTQAIGLTKRSTTSENEFIQ